MAGFGRPPPDRPGGGLRVRKVLTNSALAAPSAGLEKFPVRASSSKAALEAGDNRICALRRDASVRAESRLGQRKTTLRTFAGRLVTSHSITCNTRSSDVRVDIGVTVAVGRRVGIGVMVVAGLWVAVASSVTVTDGKPPQPNNRSAKNRIRKKNGAAIFLILIILFLTLNTPWYPNAHVGIHPIVSRLPRRIRRKATITVKVRVIQDQIHEHIRKILASSFPARLIEWIWLAWLCIASISIIGSCPCTATSWNAFYILTILIIDGCAPKYSSPISKCTSLDQEKIDGKASFAKGLFHR